MLSSPLDPHRLSFPMVNNNAYYPICVDNSTLKNGEMREEKKGRRNRAAPILGSAPPLAEYLPAGDLNHPKPHDYSRFWHVALLVNCSSLYQSPSWPAGASTPPDIFE